MTHQGTLIGNHRPADSLEGGKIVEGWRSEFAVRAGAAGVHRVGVMIEVPAAALSAREIFAHTDFVSLGTNDLAQYLFAADRQLGAVSALNDPWQPALLRLVALVGEAAIAAGKRRLRRGGRRPGARLRAGRPRHHEPVRPPQRAPPHRRPPGLGQHYRLPAGRHRRARRTDPAAARAAARNALAEADQVP